MEVDSPKLIANLKELDECANQLFMIVGALKVLGFSGFSDLCTRVSKLASTVADARSYICAALDIRLDTDPPNSKER